MNIHIFTYVFYPEPIVVSTIVEDLATALSEHHKVTVVTSQPCRPHGYALPEEINKPKWPFKRVVLQSYTHPQSEFIGRLKENISFGRAARKYIHLHHDEIDVIYMQAFPLFAQAMIIKAACRYGINVVNHVEDIYPEPFRKKIPIIGSIVYRFLLPLDKWIMHHSRCAVVIGNKIKDFFVLTRKADKARINVVYNWQDESRFAFLDLHKKQSDDSFMFMYVGSLSKAADLHNVLRAFIDSGLKNARLVFAGSGTEKESLKRESAGYPNISFEDASFNQIAEIQSKADVLILPLLSGVSLRAVPSKLPAYLFSHKPVLACVEKNSDVAQIISEGRCGWVSEPEHPRELSEMMCRISRIHKSELQEMGEAGYAYSQKHLTKEVNLNRLVDIVVNAAKK